MPCRIITDVHEGTNEIPTVPANYPVNLQSGEQSGEICREEKTLRALLQLEPVHQAAIQSVVRRLRSLVPGPDGVKNGTLTMVVGWTYLMRRGHVQVGSLAGAAHLR